LLAAGGLMGCDVLPIPSDTPARPAQITVVKKLDNAPDPFLALDPQTGEARVLLDSLGHYGRDHHWSPDGERLAYSDACFRDCLPHGAETRMVYVMNADGTNRHVVSLWRNNGKLEPNPFGTKSRPIWAPSGERIAYTRCMNCELGGLNYEVFTIDLDTTDGINLIRLTDNSYGDYVEDWSPDGQHVLYSSDVQPDGTSNRYFATYKIAADGSGQRRSVLVSDSSFATANARYSPDGKHVAYLGGPEGRKVDVANEVYVQNIQGCDPSDESKSKRQDRCAPRQLTDNDLDEREIAWSPDGSKIAFRAEYEYMTYLPKGGHIYVINADGTGLKKLTSGDPVYGRPEWRPPSH
jgi:Tol biopolymer transport system component